MTAPRSPNWIKEVAIIIASTLIGFALMFGAIAGAIFMLAAALYGAFELIAWIGQLAALAGEWSAV